MKRFCVAVVLLTSLGIVLPAQQSALDRPAADVSVPVPLWLGDMPFIASKIAEAAQAPLGFQAAPRLPSGTEKRDSRSLSGMTVRQVFDLLVSLDPRYRWQELNGVAVFRPVAAWTDENDILNRKIGPVDLESVTPQQAVRSLTSLLVGYPIRATDTVDVKEQPSGRIFSVHSGGGRLIDVLNAVVKANGELMWHVGPDPREPNRIRVMLEGFDGMGVGSAWTAPR